MPEPFARRIRAPSAPEAPGATWSNALLIGDEIAISGVTARGADGRPMGGDSMRDQTLAIFERIDALVTAAGGGRGSIYKLVIYVTDIARKDEVNAARRAFFSPAFPCSTLVEVKGLVFPDLLVEVDAFANRRVDLHAPAMAEA